MRVVTTVRELTAPAPGVSRAVVMTMGALHNGHLALVRGARELADEVIVTIFVNPLQFNDSSDLQRYPRNLDSDCALLAVEAPDIVFSPEASEVYPLGEPTVTVSAGAIGKVFEGEHRPGHFDGVLTVVLKLMNITRPHVALFGQKDAQQVIAIRAMVRDLNIPVEIVTVPTVRGADGLALSSRNTFLSTEERSEATALNAALLACVRAAEAGESADAVVAAGLAALAEAPAIRLDYLGLMDPASAAPVRSDYRGEVIVAIAARVGETRLIDNMTTTIRGGAG